MSALFFVTIFRLEQFYPQDVDFTSFFNSLDENTYNDEMDYLLTLGNDPSVAASVASTPALPAATTGGVSGEVMMIPPLPSSTRVSTLKIKRDTIPPKEALSLSKFGKSTSKFQMKSQQPNSSDSDDEDDYKRRRGDDEDPGKTERRERNREHAKKSRIRKKVMLDTLSDQLTSLRNMNIQLRRIVTEKLPPHIAAKIFNECTTEESILLHDSPSMSAGSGPGMGTTLALSHDGNNFSKLSTFSTTSKPATPSTRILFEPDFRLIHALLNSQQNFVLSDPSLPDNPIVYASDGFCKMTGYKKQDVLGRNCEYFTYISIDHIS